MNSAILSSLQAARAAEKEQAIFYRALAAAAESAGDSAAAEDLNGLHADEQHHLSRLTARLLELNEQVEDLSAVPPPSVDYASWQAVARSREQDEVQRYETLARAELDEATATLIEEILDVERKHAQALGGKFMNA